MKLFAAALSLVLATGGILPGRALVSCARSGEREAARCCCADLSSSRESSCGDCGKGTCADAAGAMEDPGPRDGPGLDDGAALLSGRCCTVTYERPESRTAARSGTEAAFKKALDEARLVLTAIAPRLDPPALEIGARRLDSTREARGAPPPIYLLHRVLLI